MALFESSTLSRYEFDGREILCPVCGHDIFFKKSVPVEEKQRALFGIDEVQGDVVCLICDVCGYILWFYQDGAAISDEEMEREKRIVPVTEGDYEQYVAGLDKHEIEEVLNSIDRDGYPRKYRLLKRRLKKLITAETMGTDEEEPENAEISEESEVESDQSEEYNH